MAALEKRFYYKTTAGETGSATIYGAEDDCPAPRLAAAVDGATAYIKLGDITDDKATPVRVELDGVVYAVLSEYVADLLFGFDDSGLNTFDNGTFATVLPQIVTTGDMMGFAGGGLNPFNCGAFGLVKRNKVARA